MRQGATCRRRTATASSSRAIIAGGLPTEQRRPHGEPADALVERSWTHGEGIRRGASERPQYGRAWQAGVIPVTVGEDDLHAGDRAVGILPVTGVHAT